MIRPFAYVVGLHLFAGCALGPGAPATEVRAVLTSALDPSGRGLASGWLRLSSDYELLLESVALQPEGAVLQQRSAASGGGSFDPANPPPGYSCHGGHCHTPDGRDLSYEEVAAELSGGGGYLPVAAFTAPGGELELLAGTQTVTLHCVDCALDAGEVSRAQASLSTLWASGRVRDGRTAARFAGERTFSFSLPEEDTPLSLSAPLTLVSDRFSPAEVEVTLSVTLTPSVFDAVDWAALEPDGDGHLALDSEANHEALDELLARFATTALTAEAP